MTATIQVVLADDQPLVRAGLRLVLGTEPDLDIVAECDDGDAVIEATKTRRPDIVLMDVRMPVVDGIAATTAIRELPGAPPVLMLTTFDDDDVVWGAIRAGAAGFVLKDSDPDELVRAVRTVAAGDSWLDPRVTPRILAAVRGRAVPAAAGSISLLSRRETDVLRLIAGGANNREIADALHVSERTVKSHVGMIFSKLGVRDRAGAIVVAFEGGLVNGP